MMFTKIESRNSKNGEQGCEYDGVSVDGMARGIG
jgi:hypothetical protein